MIEISRREFTSFIHKRYKGLAFEKKIVNYFYSHLGAGENKKLRYNEFYQ